MYMFFEVSDMTVYTPPTAEAKERHHKLRNGFVSEMHHIRVVDTVSARDGDRYVCHH
jgi:hypothetical protein